MFPGAGQRFLVRAGEADCFGTPTGLRSAPQLMKVHILAAAKTATWAPIVSTAVGRCSGGPTPRRLARRCAGTVTPCFAKARHGGTCLTAAHRGGRSSSSKLKPQPQLPTDARNPDQREQQPDLEQPNRSVNRLEGVVLGVDEKNQMVMAKPATATTSGQRGRCGNSATNAHR